MEHTPTTKLCFLLNRFSSEMAEQNYTHAYHTTHDVLRLVRRHAKPTHIRMYPFKPTTHTERLRCAQVLSLVCVHAFDAQKFAESAQAATELVEVLDLILKNK